MYRELHQRKFKSLHEELDFLRKDFVASRKTLALLHGDKVRLERELMARVLEMNELQGKLEDAQREAVQQTPSQCWRVGSSGSRGRMCSGCCCGEQDLDGFGQCAVCKASGTRANAGDMVQVSRDTAADCGDEGERQRRCGSAKKSSEVKAPSHVSTRHTGLSLYAASGQRRSGAAAGGGTSARGPDNIDPRELIRDLRANLSRRDTALNEAQMELGSLQQIRRTLETERRRLQDNLSEVKTQRDALQTKLTSQEELHTAKVAQVSELEAHVQQLKKENDELQRQLTTVQLLYEHTGPVGNGGSSASATGVGIGRGYAQEEALREQLQLYRSKWQAAEDQMEHLHERISQLQRQLVAGGADDMATAGPLKPLPREPSGDIQAVVQEAKYTADMVALRRQHQEQLQQHIEEEQRLQRRLERAQENAAFHEDQLRQQRQDDARQHHSEVQALQAQLRTAQGELVKAQEDREHLARQLRRSTEQQTTVEVLRSQVDQLKQRLGEVGAELAQVHGREKEMSLQVQRERLQRVKSQHDLEVAQEMLEREKTEAQYLREELIIAREQLGMHEATDASVTGTAPARPCLSSTCAPSATDTEAKPCRCGARTARGTVGAEGDAETLSSELKGYVGLMRVNTALQRRINELEAQVLAPHGREKAKGGNTNSTEGEMQQAKLTNLPSERCGWSKASPDNASPPSALEQQQAAHLEAELASALQSQRALMESFAEAEKERRQLIKDNQTLADGVELLEKQLCKYQAKCALKAITVDIKATHAEGGPQRRCHRCSSTHECESRVRSRLNKARAQDHHVEVQQSAGGQLQLSHAKESESATQSLCPVSGSCRDSPGPPLRLHVQPVQHRLRPSPPRMVSR
ncbi:actin-interacting protein-like protein [Leishmania tarentolae]|uniref:Actin-interacting protein-like protein n=1 Tax=Leishmania tarentolae TaxID=5689 RepID=A0A640KIC2_LEITA|nr:actin-interacting protein-like protein [Leishmania tarentolae]